MSETEDRWYVNVGSDDVRMMTLDELVDAFENGIITRDTLVVEVGGNEWQPLKEVADLGDEDPVPAAAPARALPSTAQSLPTRPPVKQSFPPQAVSRDSAWPAANAWPSVIPAAAVGRPSSAPLSGIPNSTIPVARDLDLDIPVRSFKSGRKSAVMFALAAVAVAGGVGFAMSKSGGVASSPVPVPAAAPVAIKDPTPYSSPKDEPAPAAAPQKDSDERLSDDQKKALLTADKDRDDKKRTRAVSAPRSGGGSAPKSGAVFKANGNANDPLNPTL
jgi:hypothetical protein